MKVVVIGAGIVGQSIAYRLALRGVEVTVVGDRLDGGGASSNNAGWIVPSFSGPLSSPGIVLETLGRMRKRDSPLYVRPVPDPGHVMFMARMLLACNASAFWRGFAAEFALASGAGRELDAYAADGIRFEMHRTGLLRLFTTEQHFDKERAGMERRRAAGLDSEALTGDQARAVEPALGAGVVGAIRYAQERHVQPVSLMAGLGARCRDLGVEYRAGLATEAEARSSSMVRIGGGFGRVSADACVIAAGSWSGQVSAHFGTRLPVRPGKGYAIDYEPVPGRPRIPLYLGEASVAVSPFDQGLRVAGTMEFGGADERVDPIRMRAVMRAPGAYLASWDPDAPSGTPVAGLRPMTPDGVPVIGRLPSHRNVFVATGHGMLGVTLAAPTATELVRMVVDDEMPEVLLPFDPGRFARRLRWPR